ncbi:MAG: pre-peptidase C-terminal domain-containing protein [Deltaproteobacteria bacterium]|nr:pre-peptidase C-terminal domain-containing protein [Deltaproteobacteria bacterium]
MPAPVSEAGRETPMSTETTVLFAATARLACAGIALFLLAACPPPGSDPPQPEPITVGTQVDELSCTDDIDCPLGYRCDGAICIAIDNDLDNDGFAASVDCDDTDRQVNPDASEVCNGVDDDCDGDVDEGVRNACGGCGPTPVEICDLLDNDCDGFVDNGCTAGEIAEQEPNDGSAACQYIALPPAAGETSILLGAFDPAGDVDSYCFSVRAGTALIFDIDSQALGAPTDAALQLYGSDGMPLPNGYNDYSEGADPYLPYTFDDDGSYRLDVFNFYSDQGGPTYYYRLNVTATAVILCEDQDEDGVTPCDGDCNDGDNLIFPNQTEVCDLVDNNCDGVVDEGCPSSTNAEVEPNGTMAECQLLSLPFSIEGVIDPRKDKDLFCFFVPGGAEVSFDIDAQEPPFGSLLNSRLRLLIAPGTVVVSNDDGVDPDTGYTETDSDSYLFHSFEKPGVYAIQVEDESLLAGGSRLTYLLHARALLWPVCNDTDNDGVTVCEGDCADNDPAVHFGALEICDGKDNDCDGVGDPAECRGDFDGDGYAGAEGDCADGDPTRHPGAVEICDGLDNNCDGEIDEGVTNACGGCGFAPAERCGDGVDNDCDGVTDDDCDADADHDNYTPDQGDCDDTDPAVKPGVAEACNGIDDNCNGLVDEYVKNSCGECAPEPVEICDGLDNNCNGLIDDGALNACGTCGPAPIEVCDGIDNDCDGLTDEDVTNACGECGPLPGEACDGIDNDCNGSIDEGCTDDNDHDNVTRAQGDCDDGDPFTAYGLPERCGDGVDNNCNGWIDDGCPPPAEVEPNNTALSCNSLLWPGWVAGTITTATDSDVYCFTVPVDGVTLGFDVDARDNGSPLDAVLELYDAGGDMIGTNNNCEDPDTGLGTVDPYLSYTFERAGSYTVKVRAYGTGSTAGADSVYTLHVRPEGGCLDLDRDLVNSCDGDCDDLNAVVYTGAVDFCDGLDNNCDSDIDERCVGDCLDDLLEQNDTIAAAVPVADGNYPGLAYCGGDHDYYSVQLLAGRYLRVELLFSHDEVDLTLILLASDGVTPLATSATSTDNETVTVQVPADGIYFIHVSGPLGDQGGYELVVMVTQ